MEDFLAPILAGILVFITQFVVYTIYKKTKNTVTSMIPNAVLFGVGLIFVLITYIAAVNTVGSWADLAAIIMLMLVFFATFASTLTSVLMLYLLSRKK
jgi:uncharacterized membrane protein